MQPTKLFKAESAVVFFDGHTLKEIIGFTMLVRRMNCRLSGNRVIFNSDNSYMEIEERGDETILTAYDTDGKLLRSNENE